MTRPGVRVRALAARWCSAKTMERLVDPAIADLQVEYEEALRDGGRWRATRAWVAGHWALMTVVAWHAASTMLGSLSTLTADDRRIAIRTSAFAIVASVIFACALQAPPTLNELFRIGADAWRYVPYLLPQAVPLAIPLGLPFAILIGIRRRGVSRGLRTLILLLAVLASFASFATLVWLLPAANQGYRVALFRSFGAPPTITLSKGPPEMTLAELREAIVVRQRRAERFALTNDLWRLELGYHRRFALASAPLVLAIAALVVAHRLGHRRVMTVCVGSATIVGYWLLMYAAERSHAPPAIVAWTPSVAMLLLTLAMARLVPSPADARAISA